MIKATFQKYTLQFKRPAGTSRGMLTEKPTWLLMIEKDGHRGVGECSPIGFYPRERGNSYQWTCMDGR